VGDLIDETFYIRRKSLMLMCGLSLYKKALHSGTVQKMQEKPKKVKFPRTPLKTLIHTMYRKTRETSIKIFDQPRIYVGFDDIINNMSESQLKETAKWSFVPVDPINPMSKDNLLLVRKSQKLVLWMSGDKQKTRMTTPLF